VNTLPPPTGTSDTGPRTVPPLVLAGALEDGAVLVGALVGAELVPVVAGAELEPLPAPASLLPPQAARIGAPAPTRAAIAAQRSTDLRSRRLSAGATSGVCCGVGGAIVSSLMNLDLQELAGQSS
jgi:hypothetical protein